MPPENEILNKNQTLLIPSMQKAAPSEQNRILSKNELRSFVEAADRTMSGRYWDELKEKLLAYCDMEVGPYSKRGQRLAEISLFRELLQKIRPMAKLKAAAYDRFALEKAPETSDYASEVEADLAKEEYRRREQTAHQELTTASYLLSWFESRNDGDLARMAWGSGNLKKEELLEARDHVLSLKKNTKMERVREDEPLFPHDPCMGDLMQGALGDCYLLTSLGILCNRNPEKIKEMIRDNHDGTVTVRLFHKEKEGDRLVQKPLYIRMDKSVPRQEDYEQKLAEDRVYSGDVYGKGALWVQLIEKAYTLSAQHITPEARQLKEGHLNVDPRIHQVYDDFERQAFPKLLELLPDQARKSELQTAFQAELEYRGDPLHRQAPDPRIGLDRLLLELQAAHTEKKAVDTALKNVPRPDRKRFPELYPGKPGTLPRRYHVSYDDIEGGIPSDFVTMILGEEMPGFGSTRTSDYLSWRQGEKRVYVEKGGRFSADMERLLAGNPPAPEEERLDFLWDKLQVLETAGEDPSSLNQLKEDLVGFLRKTAEKDAEISPELKKLCQRIAGTASVTRADMTEFLGALGTGPEHEKVRKAFGALLTDQLSGYKKRADRDELIQIETRQDFVRRNFRDGLKNSLNRVLSAKMRQNSSITEYNQAVRVQRFFRAHELDPLYAEAVSLYLLEGKLPAADRYGKLSREEPLASQAVAYDNIVRKTAEEGVVWSRGQDPFFRLEEVCGDVELSPEMPPLLELLEGAAKKEPVRPSGPKALGQYLPEEEALYRKLAQLTDPEKKYGSFTVAAGSRKPWTASDEPLPGVYAGHAYGVLGVRERMINGESYKFVQLRNPHGMGCREYFINEQEKLEGRRMKDAVPKGDRPEQGKNDGYEQNGYFELELSEYASLFPQLSVNISADCDRVRRNIALKEGTGPLCADYQELLNQFCEVLDGTNRGLRRDTDAYKNMLKTVDEARRNLMGRQELTHQELKDLFAPISEAAGTYLSTHADRKRNARMEVRYQTADTLCRLSEAFTRESAFRKPQEAMKQALTQQIGEKMVEGYTLQDKKFSFSLTKSQDEAKKQILNNIRYVAAGLVKMEHVKLALEDHTPEQLQRMVNHMDHRELIASVTKCYRRDDAQQTRTREAQAAPRREAQAARPRTDGPAAPEPGAPELI